VKTWSDASVISEAASPVKVISPDRALVLPPKRISDGDKYEAQIVQHETIRLNEQCAVELLKSLLDLVHKRNEDVTHLKNNSSSLKLQLNELKEPMKIQPRNVDYSSAGSMSPNRSPRMCPGSIQCHQPLLTQHSLHPQLLPPVPQLTLQGHRVSWPATCCTCGFRR
jgi:hypothetical protein